MLHPRHLNVFQLMGVVDTLEEKGAVGLGVVLVRPGAAFGRPAGEGLVLQDLEELTSAVSFEGVAVESPKLRELYVMLSMVG